MCTLVLAGCATATNGESGGVDATIKLDGNGGGKMDAPMQMIDAPSGPQMVTLTQTTSQALKALNSIACGANGYTRSNNYYRVFDLAAMGVTGDFHVSQVTFQVESCDHVAAGNGINVAVRVGTYSGTPGNTLTTANMNILASSATVAVPEVVEATGPPPSTPGATVNAPITATVPGNMKLLVEVDVPDGNNNFGFYFGSNDGGESAYGYILAPDCSVNDPTNISSLGTTAAARNLLLTVTGTY